jgi:hypothetical protein
MATFEVPEAIHMLVGKFELGLVDEYGDVS